MLLRFLAAFPMNMRWSGAPRLVAITGLFWLAIMFALTFSEYLSRTGTAGI